MAEKIEVTMEDGRVVEFGAKQKMIKTSTIEGSSISCQMDFSNGKSLTFLVPNKEMAAKFAAHGVEQKLGDEIAGILEVDDCYLAVESLMARLDSGEWAKVRASNGMAGTSVLIRALVEFTGKDVEVIKTYLKDKTQGQKLALRNNPQVKVIVDRLEAEKVAKNPKEAIDTEALLSELV